MSDSRADVSERILSVDDVQVYRDDFYVADEPNVEALVDSHEALRAERDEWKLEAERGKWPKKKAQEFFALRAERDKAWAAVKDEAEQTCIALDERDALAAEIAEQWMPLREVAVAAKAVYDEFIQDMGDDLWRNPPMEALGKALNKLREWKDG